MSDKVSFITRRERIDEREAIHCSLCRQDLYILDPGKPQEKMVSEGSDLVIEHMKERHPDEYDSLGD